MMGYPAACTLTPLPPTAMSAPAVPQTPPQAEAVEGCNTKYASRHLMQWHIHVHLPLHKGAHVLTYAEPHTWWRASRHLRSSSHLCTRSQPRTLRLQVAALRRNVGQRWNHCAEDGGGRAGGLQMQRVCQRWHQQKQYYHAVQCSWFWFTECKQSPLCLSARFYTWSIMEAYHLMSVQRYT